MGFELQLQRVLQPELLLQMLLPPGVDPLHQRPADLRRLLLVMRLFQPHEGGVGIAVNHLIAFGFDQLAGLAHDLVAAQGDRRRQPRIEEAAAARSQHAVQRVHDDLQRLRQGFVVLALGGLAPLPDLFDDRRQAVFAAREAGVAKAGHRVGVAWVAHAFHQPDRIDQEGTDDRRVQAL